MSSIACRCSLGLWLTASALAPPADAAAGRRPVDARYVATIAGIKIGEARLEGVIESNGAFTVDLTSRYRVLMWSGRATGRSSGSIAGQDIARSVYSLRTEAKDERTATVAIEGGRVVSAEVDPPAKTEGRVPVLDEHKRGVVDPIAGLIVGAIRAAHAPTPCSGTLPVYTGWNRFDLSFAPAPRIGTADAASGLGSELKSCKVRVGLISGHKSDGDSAAAALARSGDIRISFISRDAGGLMLPQSISVPLWLGTIEVRRVPSKQGTLSPGGRAAAE